ncbi:MAG: hypothetical protein K9N35_00370 [Candidatus Marinimicrobia bacterium]|nr:hypothetical protein [Candidatus Neomarinimicrobiota bacterium]
MQQLLVRAFILMVACGATFGQATPFWPEGRETIRDKHELSFIGYYLTRYEAINVAPTNEFLKGQVVGRFYGGNTTKSYSDSYANYVEQRFLGMLSYSPRLFDGWARMRMSFELDWTWGDANYGAGGNFGGAFGADFVNMQTQNLFMEFHPNKKWYVNLGLLRFYDNTSVPYYTGTSELLTTGYRLSLFASDASGLSAHFSPNTYQHFKAGAYQLYENNVDQNDDVFLFELDVEQDLSIKSTLGLTVYHLRDYASGEGGVSILGQGLNSGLANYNGVFNFNLGSEPYDARLWWFGAHFDSDPLLAQGRFGMSGFAYTTRGVVSTATRDIDVAGYAANVRLAYKYGKTDRDRFVLDGIFSTGDTKNVDDGKYTGVLTGNNWTSPGAVFFGTGLYLLLPHGDVVNRYYASTIDIQNMGYGLAAGIAQLSYDIIPYKLRAEANLGYAVSPVAPVGGGNNMGFEKNVGVVFSPKVFFDIEMHAAHLSLGDFYDSTDTNGNITGRPADPWTFILLLKWIMF